MCGVALAMAAAALAGALSRPGRPPALELLRVTDVVPRELDLGALVTIRGEGFVTGRPARITLRGTLYRPGEGAEEGVELVTEGTVVSPDRIETDFDASFAASLCRGGDRATHTSFEGDIEVAFESALAGQPPVIGAL